VVTVGRRAPARRRLLLAIQPRGARVAPAGRGRGRAPRPWEPAPAPHKVTAKTSSRADVRFASGVRGWSRIGRAATLVPKRAHVVARRSAFNARSARLLVIHRAHQSSRPEKNGEFCPGPRDWSAAPALRPPRASSAPRLLLKLLGANAQSGWPNERVSDDAPPLIAGDRWASGLALSPRARASSDNRPFSLGRMQSAAPPNKRVSRPAPIPVTTTPPVPQARYNGEACSLRSAHGAPVPQL
jgi:hypothetical protein